MPILRVKTKGTPPPLLGFGSRGGWSLRLQQVAFGFPQTNSPPLRSAFEFPYIKRERIGKATSDLPATASREHPTFTLRCSLSPNPTALPLGARTGLQSVAFRQRLGAFGKSINPHRPHIRGIRKAAGQQSTALHKEKT